MAQYKSGTVSVTNNSNAIVGSGTAWLANVRVGSVFSIPGQNTPYIVGSVNSDTSITLTSLFAGSTASGLTYAITTSFTPNLSLPYPETGDVDTATILKRAMLLIDQDISGPAVTINGTSTTSMTPGFGVSSCTTQTGKQFAYPQYMVIQSVGTPTAYMNVQVTAYNATSGLLNFNVLSFGGSGAHTDWALSLSGQPGQAIEWVGAWNSATAYIIGNAISYNGSAYICVAANTNQVPPNATYWGILDMGWFYRGAWSSATAYNPNDVVTSGGSSYICLTGNTNNVPPNATYWGLVASIGNTGATGAAGAAATIAVGTTTTLAAGASATVTNSGSSSAAVFNFSIPQGITGATGAAGNTVLYGTGAPGSGTGVAGNFYIDTAANFIYGPKTSSWPAGTSLVGPTGATGPTGPGWNQWKGAWSSATAYVVNDVVSISGSSYICILGNTNNTPPNATYWNLVAQAGSGTGTVTSVSATGSNGVTLSVATPTTTPAITMSVATQAANDNSTNVATTAFAQTAVNGSTTVNVAGGSDVTLTAVQSAAQIIILTGALTGSINVLLASNASKTFTVENNTSGAFTVTVKSNTGSGILVTQGKTQELICDGTNVVLASNDLAGSGISPVAGSGSITTVGTIGTGTWQGSVIAGQYGGTGVANTGKTFTIGGNFSTVGAFTLAMTVSANTAVTLPTSGTLATTANINSALPSTSALYKGTGGAGVAQAAVAGVDYGFPNIPQNSQSAAYTLVLGDAGGHIFHPAADTTARTYTIPANSSVAYPIGTAITFVNQFGSGVNVTIAITTDTMRLVPAGTTGSRTLAPGGQATALKVTSTEWQISGGGLT